MNQSPTHSENLSSTPIIHPARDSQPRAVSARWRKGQQQELQMSDEVRAVESMEAVAGGMDGAQTPTILTVAESGDADDVSSAGEAGGRPPEGGDLAQGPVPDDTSLRSGMGLLGLGASGASGGLAGLGGFGGLAGLAGIAGIGGLAAGSGSSSSPHIAPPVADHDTTPPLTPSAATTDPVVGPSAGEAGSGSHSSDIPVAPSNPADDTAHTVPAAAPEAEQAPVGLSAPSVQVLRGSGAGTSADPILINAQGALTVQADPGAEWLYSTDGGQTWKLGAASELAADELLEGTHPVQIIQRDATGRSSPVTVLEVERDTLAPAAPLVEVMGGSGTGTEADPMLINGRGTLSVLVEPGTQWHYSLDGGQTWRGGGTVGIAAADLQEGHNHLLVASYDAAGNRSEPVTLEVTKDGIAERLGYTISGMAGMDNAWTLYFTNPSATLSLTSLESGAHVEVRNGPTGTWNDLGTASSYELKDLGLTQDATNTLALRQVDAWGNISDERGLTLVYMPSSMPELPWHPSSISVAG